jgi:formylglycine-generating enzyme required for sulfatase activity
MAFCAWLTQHLNDGYAYRLPSEVEWELAARGGERRPYAWGEAEPDPERANFNSTFGATTPVGPFASGATPGTGLFDMTGNVWEWTRSEYRPYPYDANDGREDLSNLQQKSFTLRGDSWYEIPIYLRAANRYVNSPDYRIVYVGFRLARHKQ